MELATTPHRGAKRGKVRDFYKQTNEEQCVIDDKFFIIQSIYTARDIQWQCSSWATPGFVFLKISSGFVSKGYLPWPFEVIMTYQYLAFSRSTLSSIQKDLC